MILFPARPKLRLERGSEPPFLEVNDRTLQCEKRGLAEAFHALGNQVIVAGRRREALDETTAAFLAEAMEILKTQPTVAEICVERVKPIRFAARNGQYDSVFNGLNRQ